MGVCVRLGVGIERMGIEKITSEILRDMLFSRRPLGCGRFASINVCYFALHRL